jgi:hypothetical protein
LILEYAIETRREPGELSCCEPEIIYESSLSGAPELYDGTDIVEAIKFIAGRHVIRLSHL